VFRPEPDQVVSGPQRGRMAHQHRKQAQQRPGANVIKLFLSVIYDFPQ
jgi:hypothetical protein